jgi:triacylglycerol lipase
MTRTSSAPTDTVVLIHGLGRTPRSMWVVGAWLRFCGYRVRFIGYPSRSMSIAEAVERHIEPGLAELQLEAGSRVHFVTHSLGGIVFRAWAARRDPAFPLGRAVLLVPPNQGSEIIDMVRPLGWPRWVLGPVVDELGTEPHHTPKALGPLPPETGVLMGNKGTLRLFGHVLGEEHDGIVSTQGGQVEGQADFTVLPVNHLTVLFRPVVMRTVRRFLRTGRFAG